jgi:hypothetical protein
MSCKDCKEAQEKGIFYYYRWKNANIARKLSKEWYVAPKVLEELAKYEG